MNKEFIAGEDIEQHDAVIEKNNIVYKAEPVAVCTCPPNNEQRGKKWVCPAHGVCVS